METSQTISKIAVALLASQKEMSNAIKGSKNPFFKSTYADLNSVREACLPALNNNGISIIQPTIFKDGKNFINTILIHESGEFISGLTEIVYSKQNDAQSQGSGITYARRYGIQSICNIGVEDDDGNNASNNKTTNEEPILPWLNEQDPNFEAIKQAIKDGKRTIQQLRLKYKISKEIEAKLNA